MGENLPISRDEAIRLVDEHIKTKNLKKHVLAVGACMRKLAEELGGDPDLWELAGLLHDLDYEKTKEAPDKHAFITIDLLKKLGVDHKELLEAILAHADKKSVKSPFEVAIYAADPATGFIVACALMHPEKRIKSLDVPFLMRRFKEKRFAQGASREQMRAIERLGISLERFFEICLEAMGEMSEQLGL